MVSDPPLIPPPQETLSCSAKLWAGHPQPPWGLCTTAALSPTHGPSPASRDLHHAAHPLHALDKDGRYVCVPVESRKAAEELGPCPSPVGLRVAAATVLRAQAHGLVACGGPKVKHIVLWNQRRTESGVLSLTSRRRKRTLLCVTPPPPPCASTLKVRKTTVRRLGLANNTENHFKLRKSVCCEADDGVASQPTKPTAGMSKPDEVVGSPTTAVGSCRELPPTKAISGSTTCRRCIPLTWRAH